MQLILERLGNLELLGKEATSKISKIEEVLPVKLTPRAAAAVKGSLFLIYDDQTIHQGPKRRKLTTSALTAHDASLSSLHGDPEQFIGSGFFYLEHNLAVTPWHQLSAEQLARQQPVKVRMLETHVVKELEYVDGCKELDVAYMRSKIPDATQLFLVPDNELDMDFAINTEVVLFSTSLIIWRDSNPPRQHPGIGQRAGRISAVMDDRTTFTYSTSTYAGDCGCPVIVRNGKLVGMHREVFNEYKEGSDVSKSLASSGPHDAVAVFAAAFPPVPEAALLGPTAPAAPAGNNSQDGAASTFAGAAVGQV